MFGGPLRVAPYATFGSRELAANVAAAMEGRTAALMSNHGGVTTGPDLPSAGEAAQYLEYVCDVKLRAVSRTAGPDAVYSSARRSRRLARLISPAAPTRNLTQPGKAQCAWRVRLPATARQPAGGSMWTPIATLALHLATTVP